MCHSGRHRPLILPVVSRTSPGCSAHFTAHQITVKPTYHPTTSTRPPTTSSFASKIHYLLQRTRLPHQRPQQSHQPRRLIVSARPRALRARRTRLLIRQDDATLGAVEALLAVVRVALFGHFRDGNVIFTRHGSVHRALWRASEAAVAVRARLRWRAAGVVELAEEVVGVNATVQPVSSKIG